MRLLHTADWHLGRTLEGRSRHLEQEAVLDEIIAIADEEEVDAILMAGDVYDSVNPPAASEMLFYETIQRLSKGGRRPVIVISGNHDSPERVEASSPIASSQGIILVGRPIQQPPIIRVPTCNEALVVSAIPYPSESRLNECLSEMNEETQIREAYDQRLAFLFKSHAHAFKKDTVNIIMSHLFVAGGKESDSERPIQIGGAYTISPSSLDVGADYVALGHLHRPQQLKFGKTPGRYSGSPLAYSFSEAHQPKSVTILDMTPGQPTEIKEIYLSAGKPLVRWTAENGLEEVHQWIEAGKDANAWIDLEISLTDALSLRDIQQLRKAHDGLVHIRPRYLQDESDVEQERLADLPLQDIFARFYRQQTGGAEPESSLVELFLEIAKETEEEGGDGNETH
ncbi:exonuclease SbcD [Pullulanibacillus pueri]|uniref:Nuclease SbcCD subunit D n=1 Tax=Pullulanibacillus pueri TaxID=1437324 RepID=A0A8J2ZYK8_9BACL|nr:exonuclease SbcCD subunit D [Pullulanibacillus pueri]MBM7680539.1 exonuclease SbcD [Pullulanibacillus pueri]GGH86160.1 nuclease SbcCD subunit D [Pullulanibacillus pueri]